MRSRSSRNSGLVGARGARWVVAKFRAGVMSALSDVHVRISSTSWRRSREKCRDESWSRILSEVVSGDLDCWLGAEQYRSDGFAHFED